MTVYNVNDTQPKTRLESASFPLQQRSLENFGDHFLKKSSTPGFPGRVLAQMQLRSFLHSNLHPLIKMSRCIAHTRQSDFIFMLHDIAFVCSITQLRLRVNMPLGSICFAPVIWSSEQASKIFKKSRYYPHCSERGGCGAA